MTHSSVARVLAALVVCGASTPVLAQSPPLVVERPSFSTPPNVVGAGFWQVEAGVGWDHDAPDDGDGTTVFTAPNTTLRLGMTRRFELRAATSGLVSVSEAGRRQTSAADTALGLKYQVAFQDGFGLDVAVVPMISLPTGGTASSNNADPSMILTAARQFGRAQLNGNASGRARVTATPPTSTPGGSTGASSSPIHCGAGGARSAKASPATRIAATRRRHGPQTPGWSGSSATRSSSTSTVDSA